MILALFLIGIALGAIVFDAIRPRDRARSGCSRSPSSAPRSWRPRADPGHPRASAARPGRAHRRTCVRVVLRHDRPGRPAGDLPDGLQLPGRLGAPRRDRDVRSAVERRSPPGRRTPWARSSATFVVPVRASSRSSARPAALASDRHPERQRWPSSSRCAAGLALRRRSNRDCGAPAASWSFCVAIAVGTGQFFVDPSIARIHDGRAVMLIRVGGGRDRIGPGRAAFGMTHLWVTGTAMTLLTVDAKLMPILPLIARPEFEDGADRGIRDGLGIPGRPDRRASRPMPSSSSRRCPRCSATTTPTRPSVLANPNARRDHRRRPEPHRADRSHATTSS